MVDVGICPYYQESDALCVHCEGGTRIVFPARTEAREYTARYCNSYEWAHCTVAASLTRYYERTDADSPRRGRPKKAAPE